MNEDKTVPPYSKLTCSGIHIDIPNNTLSIDTEKVQAIYDVCANIITKSHISKRQMQSLLGKLLYLHKCVKPARTFVNRILMTFRNSTSKRILITDAFKQDLLWFLKFLPAYNGVSILNKKCIDNSHTLHIDASLTGLGGVWANKVYSTPTYSIPNFVMKIVHWEMFNILLALRV